MTVAPSSACGRRGGLVMRQRSARFCPRRQADSPVPRHFRKAFRLVARRRDGQAREIDDEIAFHIQERVDALVERGWSVGDAEAEAARRFGDLATERRALVAAARQRDRRLDLFEWAQALRTDLIVATRRLRHAPTFAFGTI